MISVALPVYNGANYLGDALQSFADQPAEGWELVVMDNGSRDGTAGIARAFAERDPRIRVEREETTVPQVENVNRAVRLCRGEWVQFLCHDDILLPGSLDRLRREATEAPPEVGLIGHGTGMLYGKKCYVPWGAALPVEPLPFGGELPDVPEPAASPARTVNGGEWLRDCLRGRAGVELPGLTNGCVRRSAWDRLGGFDGRYMHFDLFAWLRLLAAAHYRFVPAMLTLTRIHGTQVAVEARRRMRSVHEHRQFWPEFLTGEGAPYSAGYRSRAVVFLKAVSIGASAVAMELLQGRNEAAVRMAAAVPPLMWPVLPLLVARNFRTERRRTARLRPSLGWQEIYP